VQGYVAGTLRPGMEADLKTIELALREYGIKQVLVGDAYFNNAADGATPSLTQIWDNTYIWVGKAGATFGTSDLDEDVSTGGVGVPTLQGVGANIFWEGYTPGGKISVDQDQMTF